MSYCIPQIRYSSVPCRKSCMLCMHKGIKFAKDLQLQAFDCKIQYRNYSNTHNKNSLNPELLPCCILQIWARILQVHFKNHMYYICTQEYMVPKTCNICLLSGVICKGRASFLFKSATCSPCLSFFQHHNSYLSMAIFQATPPKARKTNMIFWLPFVFLSAAIRGNCSSQDIIGMGKTAMFSGMM